MLRHSLFLIFAVLVLSASTCERPADLEIDGPEPTLVVISNFSDQGVIKVQVSTSMDALTGGSVEYVTDANVELLEGDEFIEQLQLVEPVSMPPYYTTYELKPKVGVLYTIKVHAPGFRTVSAKSVIPPQIRIDQLEVENVRQWDSGDGTRRFNYDVALSFSDPHREKNFYHLKFFQQIKEYQRIQGEIDITRVRYKEISFSALNDNNNQLAYFNGGVLFEDGMLDGQRITYSFPLETTIQPEREMLGKVVAELRAVSEDYYLYHTSLDRQQNNPGVPFTEPVFIHNNIENGQGIFAGYSVSVDSLTVLQ